MRGRLSAAALAVLAAAGCAAPGAGERSSPPAAAPPAVAAEPGAERLVPLGAPAQLVERPLPGRLAAREDTSPPRGGALSPNGSVSDRFAVSGQSATYTFQALSGELALFELICVGYSRGWQATAGVRVLGPRRRPLLTRAQEGGGTFALLVPFVAPATGMYALELSAPEQPFRYQLVRHTGFTPNAPGERRRATGERALGYLAGAQDRARFAVDVAAGEALLVEVAPAREPLRRGQEKRGAELLEGALAARRLPEVTAQGGILAAEQQRVSEEGERPSCPFFALALADDGEEEGAEKAGAERLFPAGPARRVSLDVFALGESEGGLFELRIARPALHRVAVRVGDVEDDPLPGLSVSFLREPSLAALAEAETDADGISAVDLPAGDYSLLVTRGPEGKVERTRVRIDGPQDVNLIYAGLPGG